MNSAPSCRGGCLSIPGPCRLRPAATGIAVVLFAVGNLVCAQTASDPLADGFAHPPDSAKPRVWWHWTSGNVTKEGITKDLEWMKRVGIGGMQLADVQTGGGQTVEKKILFGSPEWYDAVRFAAAEADRLGLEMSIFSSAGWSETGGPWVKPEQAMKKLVWSETNVAGPRRFIEKLPQPPTNNGVFGNLGRPGPDPTYYGDSAVIAYRTPDNETNFVDLKPRVTTAAGEINGAALMDDDLNTSVSIPSPSGGGAAWVQYDFGHPISARAITLVAPGRGIPFGRILVGDDPDHLRPMVELPGPEQYRAGTVHTYSFPELSARYFRVEMSNAAAQPAAVMNQTRPAPASAYPLSEFIVHTGARVNRWQEKAGFNFLYEYDSTPTPPVPDNAAIRPAETVNLTSKMSADGTLQWEVPAGKWTILRMGYSLTGAKNRPAPPTGSGYEADKLSRKDVESYFHGYFDPISQALGPLLGKSLRYVTMDSWEAEIQNWTEDMIPEFRARRGYDPTPYLPVLAGRVVASADVSDRFLWDFRRTIGDLLADNHYGTMAELLRQKGIGIYAEADGVSMDFMEDTLLNKSKVEIPMGEFWVHALHPEIQYYVDVRGAASAAHVYGKKIVATESFTGGGYESPYTLKKIGDYWLAQGVNRFVFHTSAHQPLDTKPGNTMTGMHLNRNMTWAGQSGPYFTYLSRCCQMLQQGLFVADLAYLLPEGIPSSQSFWGEGLRPAPPDGYDYDCINSDVLLHRMSVNSNGLLVLPDGMSYRVLVLPETDKMTVPVLRKIRELAVGGATIVGPRPEKSPSLAGYPAADTELQTLAADVWGDLDGVMRNKHYHGKGLVVWGLPLASVLNSLALAKDFEYTRNLDAEVPWIHRHTDDAEIYFLVNRADFSQNIDARFRVAGKEPELWHPDTGSVEPVGFNLSGNRTTIPLHLAGRESVFVVFRRSTDATNRALPQPIETATATVNAPWTVTFPPNLGAPPSIQLEKLEPWSANADAGVKYFSGTATYTVTLTVPPTAFRAGAKVLLDLGAVRDIAEISVNGQPLATLWKPPYRVDATAALKPGSNALEIKVTNEWTNRQIGDSASPPDRRVLAPATGLRGGGRGGLQTLPESGLLGPVTLVTSALP